ncbi:hypothetical protein [Paraburkholderia azotifigens]|uniref:hypothetical protein n=1 Tax=Paraburkholderia azotifigens TaxID=2057004 RepID=UPI001F01F859|nr:hypothetical protein [Paraburkholderia azotifigens]
MQRFEHARLIRAQRAAALQHEHDLRIDVGMRGGARVFCLAGRVDAREACAECAAACTAVFLTIVLLIVLLR